MLDFFISPAWANETLSQDGFLKLLLPWVVLFIAFWFFLIRPQIKRSKEHKAMIDSISPGDEIVTIGGLVGKIKDIGDNFISLEISKELQVKIQKQAISLTVPKGTIKTL